MCLEEIRLHAHNALTIIESIVNMIVGRGIYMTFLTSMQIFVLVMTKDWSYTQGDHSLLYFAYTCVRDLFVWGGGYLPCKQDYKVMVFYK